MDYKLKLGVWSNLFAIPCIVVDKYLSLATFNQVKVLLWILRNSNQEINSKKISMELNISEEEFKEAFIYWDKKGVFSYENSKSNNKEPETFISSFEGVKASNLSEPKKTSTRYQRPELSHVVSRIKSSEEIYYLIKEAQIILGRPISSGDSTILIMLHDNEGLPVDVILMLIQYSVSIGKSSIRSIEKTGIDWAASGVDTIEKAEKKIQNLSHSSIIWKRFERIINIDHRAPSSYEEEVILKWYDNWKVDEKLIKYAYDICINSKGKYAIHYMDGIIKRWHTQGIFTLEQAKTYILHRGSNKNNYSERASESSYSIEEYESYSIFDEK